MTDHHETRQDSTLANHEPAIDDCGCDCRCDDEAGTQTGLLGRRRFLKNSLLASGAAASVVSVAGLGLQSPRFAFADPTNPARGDLVVLLYLMGGADGLTLFPPHGEGRYYDRRPSLAVPAPGQGGGAIDLDGFFGMNPALQPLHAGPWADGNLAIVQAAGITESHPSLRSHFAAQDFSQRGTADPTVRTGWLARYLSAAGLTDGVPAVSVSGGTLDETLTGFGQAYGVSSVDRFVLDGFGGSAADDVAVRQLFATTYGADPGLLGSSASSTLGAVLQVEGSGAAGLAPRAGANYPGSALGQGLADIARLAKSNVGLQVATASTGAWDTHDAQGTKIGGLMTNLAQSLRAFYDDMGPMMNEVTVIVDSEFGRTTEENGSGGTDHGRAGAMMVLGGSVNGGVYSDWPTLTDADGEPDLRTTTDHRAVISEVLAARGNPANLGAIFPGFNRPAPLGLVA